MNLGSTWGQSLGQLGFNLGSTCTALPGGNEASTLVSVLTESVTVVSTSFSADSKSSSSMSSPRSSV